MTNKIENKSKTSILPMLILILFLTLGLLFLTSCSEEDDFIQSENPVDKQIIVSNVINIPVEKIKTLNPIISSDEDVYFMSKLIYRALFELNDDMTVKSDLVESYEFLEDGSLLLNVKNDVTWEDGTALTNKDVKFTIDAILALPRHSTNIYSKMAESIYSCRIERDGRIRVFFKHGRDRLLANFLFPIMPSFKYSNLNEFFKDTDDFIPFGTGSYKVTEIEKGEYILLEGSSEYKGILPVNQIRFNYIRNKKDAINLFNIDEVNLVYLNKIDRGTQIESDKTEIVSFMSNEFEVLIFNFENDQLQDSKLRRAIATAIDRETILNTSYFQSGLINNNLFYPGYLGIEPLELIKASNNEEITLSLIYNEKNNSRKMAANLIKENLEAININLEIIGLGEDEYFEALENRDFDLCLSGYRMNFKYDLRPILNTKGHLNYASFSNTKMDELLDQYYESVDMEEKIIIYKAIDRVFQEELPYLCLLYKTHGLAVTKGTTGNITPSFDNIFKGIEDWQINYQIKQ